MTKKEKQLLLVDLCVRLPYGVKATTTLNGWNGTYTITGYNNDRIYLDCPVYDEGDDEWLVESVKPYLRPMSSMNVVERKDLRRLTDAISIYNDGLEFESHDGYNDYIGYCFCSEIVDWLNEHHFDYRGLIKMGLALEAPEGMYNF